jgi:hypothetical protein
LISKLMLFSAACATFSHHLLPWPKGNCKSLRVNLGKWWTLKNFNCSVTQTYKNKDETKLQSFICLVNILTAPSWICIMQPRHNTWILWQNPAFLL